MLEPVVVPQRGEALRARYHTRVAMMYAVETALTTESAAPEDVELIFTGTQK